MQTNAATLTLPQPHSWPWLRALSWEIHLSWQFINGDLSSAIVPALIFFLAAWQQRGQWGHGLPLAPLPLS